MSHRHRNTHTAEVEVPIVPMLDMAFQMLTFFVVTYHPSALEGQFGVELAAAESKGGGNVRPTEVSPKITKTKPLVTVIAKATEQGGNLYSLEVQVRNTASGDPIQGSAAEAFEDESQKRMLIALENKLREIKEREGKTALPEELEKAVLRGSSNMKWADSMKVLDSMRKCVKTRINDKGNHVPESGTIRKYYDLFPIVEMDIYVGK